jgi:membrane protease YdiL (CAAX protease family)
MSPDHARVWRKVALFFALTMLFSGICDAFILHAGRMDAGNLLYVTGGMWSPALAVCLTKTIFRESIRDLPWQWGRTRYICFGYLIPLAYALPVYLVVWATGLGGFGSADFVRQTREQFGWTNFSPGLTITVFVLFTATLGLVGKLSRALGEEIGWRGFVVPELTKVVSFPAVATISGLMWAVYHYPILLFADYNAGGPSWFSLTCFTLMVVADSFILAWLTLRSGSLWPAAILHGSHNLFIQSILTPLTRDTGPTRYIIGEFGLGLVITITIGAVVIWRQRKALPITR